MMDNAGMAISYPLTFQAAILEQNYRPLVIDNVTFKGPLEPGQVLVKLHTSGICGKQLEEIDATRGADPFLPHMLGHEGCGTVIDIGPGVQKVVPGNLVVLHWVKGSGIDAATPMYVRQGERVNAGWITTFNEYAVIAENRLTPVAKDTDPAIACLLGCAATTGIGVILNEANVHPGESVVVYGCGGVGLSAVLGARLIFAYPIIAVDRNPSNLEMAKKTGATHLVLADKDDIIAEVTRITSGKKGDYVIATTSNPKALEIAVECAASPGEVFFVGVPPANTSIAVDPLMIHKRRVLRGSFGGGVFPDRDIPKYLELHKQGSIELNNIIGSIIPFNQINDGLNLLRNGITGRCILSFN